MDHLYYGVERRADGWHAHPLDMGDPDDDHRFASRDDAIAWCRERGVIALEHAPAEAYGADLDGMYY